MDQILVFARGPLFRFCFVVMVLGLLRTSAIIVFGAVDAFRKAGDKKVPVKSLLKETLGWLFPVKHILSTRAAFSVVSFVFHVGLVIVPLFLLDHIMLWKGVAGVAWPSIGKPLADALTLVTIITGVALLLNRIFQPTARFLSTITDYLILVLLLTIFTSGYVASRPYNPVPYNTTMLIHVLCGNAVLVLIPFSKLAHCILYPILRIASNMAWRFPARAGEAVNKTLYGEEIRKI